MKSFKYIKLSGVKLSPENFGGREPKYDEVLNLSLEQKLLKVEIQDYIYVEIKGVVIVTKGKKKRKFREVLWISRDGYERAKNILKPKEIYYVAHEGVSFDVAKGVWRIVNQQGPVTCPPGYEGECYIVETALSRNRGLEPFIVEGKYVYKGISGEHINKGCIESYTYLLMAFDRDKKGFLTKEELEKTLLYKNYLSNPYVQKVLKEEASKHLRDRWWHVERMREDVFAKYKVVWKDVADEFVPAVDDMGFIPDHNVHYVVIDSLEEAYYLMAILLSPQVNAVVKELSPWIGHVQPRFLRYFKIPKYNPKECVHKDLAELGRSICEKKKMSSDDLGKIEDLVNKLVQ